MPTRKSNSKERIKPESVAQKAKPKWKVVNRPAADAPATPFKDATMPALDVLQKRLKNPAAGADDASLQSARPAKKKRAEKPQTGSLVVMAPGDDADTRRAGTKTQVIEDGKHTGSQG